MGFLPSFPHHTSGLSMPKPYWGAIVRKLLVFRGKDVQDARGKTLKCAGRTDQVGTKVRTVHKAAFNGNCEGDGRPKNVMTGSFAL
jgi:hypothetical protein